MELFGLRVHMGHAPCTLALYPGVAGFVHAVGSFFKACWIWRQFCTDNTVDILSCARSVIMVEDDEDVSMGQSSLLQLYDIEVCLRSAN